MSGRAQGTLRSETELRADASVPPSRRASDSWLSSQHRQQANVIEEEHSWERVLAWDGDKRQWKRYLRDVELYLEMEKLDVDFSHGAGLLLRLTGSARKCAETIELDTIRRSNGTDKDTRESMVTGEIPAEVTRESHGHGRCH